jgi:ABC-type multidrug transport system fused ATPase/permease subunit
MIIFSSFFQLVMDTGNLVENGAPKELLENRDGIFFSMCAKAAIVAGHRA